MLGVQILLHAIRMVANNPGAALRISGVLMAVQFVLVMALGLEGLFLGEDATGMIASGDYPHGGAALVMLLQGVTALWVAVAWHRFILREEAPGTFVPAFNGRAILSYLWAGVIFLLVMILVAIPFGVLAGILAAPVMASPTAGTALSSGLILFLLLWLPVTYISYRISPILPAAALRDPLPLREAWYATGASGPAFVVLAVASVLLVWLANLPVVPLSRGARLLGFVWAFVVQWGVLLVGVSVLTTIYGLFIEKRELNV